MRNMVLSSSRLDDFMGCERKFSLTYLQGYKSKHENITPQNKGTLFHKLAEVYYKAKKDNLLEKDFAGIVQKVMDTGRALGLTKYNLTDEDTDIVVRTFRDYASYYRHENYETQEVEIPFSKVLFEQGDLRVIINGTLDLLVRNQQGHEIVIDHKTKSKDYMPGELTNQFICYAWATGRRIVMPNRVLFKLGESDEKRFKRQPYTYSARMVEEWSTMVMYRALRIDEMVRANYFPPNYTRCEMYGKCIFYSVCNQDPSGRVVELEENFIQSDEQYDDKRFG